MGYFRINFGKIGKPSKTILDQFQNGGRKGNNTKAPTKLYTRANTTAQQQKKCNLKRRLRNIYTKIDPKPHLQNLADKLNNELKQTEMKASTRKDHLGIRRRKCTKYFFQQPEKRKNADQAILSLKSRQNGKILKNQ